MSAVIELTASKIKIDYSTDLWASEPPNDSFSAFKAGSILGYRAVEGSSITTFQIILSGALIEVNYENIPEVSILGATKAKGTDYYSVQQLKDLFEATL